jgi:hypothetical protein
MHTEVPLAQDCTDSAPDCITRTDSKLIERHGVLSVMTTVMGDTEMKEGPRDPVADVFWLLMDENSVVGVRENAMWCDIE